MSTIPQSTFCNQVDPQRIRSRILHALNWPGRSRHFVSCVAAVSYRRIGSFPYGHGFMCEDMGLKDRWSISRALSHYEQDCAATGYNLFEFKRGGGKEKAITHYGPCALNIATGWIARQLRGDCQNLTAEIDSLCAEAIRQFIPRRQLAAVKNPARKINKGERRSHLALRHPPSATHLSALREATEGLRVFPLYGVTEGICQCKFGPDCDKPGKHPAVRGWLQWATSNPSVINEWWFKNPNRNVGIRTGVRLPAGGFLAVVDVDRRRFGHGHLRVLLEALDLELPETRRVDTSDGFHFYFSTTEALPSGSFGDGLDLKGTAGFVCAAGSLHATGVTYTSNNLPIAPMPQALQSFFQTRAAPRRMCAVGERHAFLRSISFTMAMQDCDEDLIVATLRQRLTQNCEQGGRVIPESELMALAQSAVMKVTGAKEMLLGRSVA